MYIPVGVNSIRNFWVIPARHSNSRKYSVIRIKLSKIFSVRKLFIAEVVINTFCNLDNLTT